MAVHVQTGAMPSPTDINFIVIEIQNEERRHFPALQKPWQSSGPETYGRNEMRWSTKAPKKAGWYLVTLKDGIVMPAYRSEYPTGNFTWKELPHGSVVIASIRFPKAYKED